MECEAILNYRTLVGQFYSIYELNSVPDLRPGTVERILPFVQVGPILPQRVDLKETILNGRTTVRYQMRRVVERQAGYGPVSDSLNGQSPVFSGDPFYHLVQINYTYQHRLSYGVTAEKDAGEAFNWSNQYRGFDFSSGYFAVQNKGRLTYAIIGDYQVSFGQGLVVRTTYQPSLSVVGMQFSHNRTIIKPYRSVNEVRYFRGGGLVLTFNHWQLSTFWSRRLKDARLNSIDDQPIISSFPVSGLHRTSSELTSRKQIIEQVGGLQIGRVFGNLGINCNMMATHFALPLDRTNQHPSLSQSSFFATASIDYRYRNRDWLVFGEAALDLEGVLATLNGVKWHLSESFTLGTVHYHFPPEYTAVQANTFLGKTLNRKGLYTIVEGQLSRRLNITGLHQFQVRPWLSHQVDGPSISHFLMGSFRLKLSDRATLNGRLTFVEKERNQSLSTLPITPQTSTKTYRLNLVYDQKMNQSWSVRSRLGIAYHFQDSEWSEGVLWAEDLIYQLPSVPMKLYGRLALFETEDYQSRLFAYEHDLRYAFSVPGFAGQGFRLAFYGRYKLGQNLTSELKIERWTYTDREVISSGSTLINGRHQTTIKFQLTCQF